MPYNLTFQGCQQGAFTLEQILARPVMPGTMIWREGLDDWLTPDKVPELASYFRQDAPHTFQSPLVANSKSWRLSFVTKRLLSLMLLVIGKRGTVRWYLANCYVIFSAAYLVALVLGSLAMLGTNPVIGVALLLLTGVQVIFHAILCEAIDISYGSGNHYNQLLPVDMDTIVLYLIRPGLVYVSRLAARRICSPA